MPHSRIASFSAAPYNQLFMYGPVAQLGARLDGIQEVTGSIPVRSITLSSSPFHGSSFGSDSLPET